jgi:hypothetical protein
MLTAKPQTKRFLEAIQFVLTLASTCAVIETMHVPAPPPGDPGYYASNRQAPGTERDRRLADLARAERKRREATLAEALQERPLRA